MNATRKKKLPANNSKKLLKKTVKELAEVLGGRIVGDKSIVITGVSGIKEAQKGDIAFLANSRYSALVNETKASAVLVDGAFNTDAIKDKSFIIVDNPSLRFTEIFDLMAPFQVKYDPYNLLIYLILDIHLSFPLFE